MVTHSRAGEVLSASALIIYSLIVAWLTKRTRLLLLKHRFIGPYFTASTGLSSAAFDSSSEACPLNAT